MLHGREASGAYKIAVEKNKGKLKGTVCENVEIDISPVQCFITANINENFTF
jgi:hypothetical protein